MAGYGDDTGFAAWLADAGLALPVGAPTPAVLRQRGSDYLDATYAARLDCSAPTGGIAQERAWPRTGHMVLGMAMGDADIPSAWVRASYRAAWREAVTPGWATSSRDPSRMTKREKADVVEREFFAPGETDLLGASGANIDAQIEGLITPFLCYVFGRLPMHMVV